MTSIDNITGNSGVGIFSTRNAQYGDNPFLSLLVTQLRSQTPLDPVDNESFMQQMATYSSMEEQKQLNDNMLKLLDYQGVLARLQGLSEGSNLLGKVVTFTGADGKPEKGKVESVYVNEQGDVLLKLGDKEISMRKVTGIEEPKPESEKNKEEDKNNEGDEKKDN